jgi:hypothetical protein
VVQRPQPGRDCHRHEDSADAQHHSGGGHREALARAPGRGPCAQPEQHGRDPQHTADHDQAQQQAADAEDERGPTGSRRAGRDLTGRGRF